MDAIAYEKQFADHLAPLWLALPEGVRGTFYVDPSLSDHAARLGVPTTPRPRPPHTVSQPKPNPGWNPCLVASYGDVKEGRRLGYGPFVFLEHGIGQTYTPERGQTRGHASYSGGQDRDDNALVLVPNEHSAAAWRASYAGVRVEVIGCPKLDGLPHREFSTDDFTGLESDAWEAFVAAIQTDQRMSVSTRPGVGVCVAHAITDASQTVPGMHGGQATLGRPNTTDAGTYFAALTLPPDPPSLVHEVTEAVRLATSTCTGSCAGFFRKSAISAEQLKDALTRRSVGIRLSQIGSSTRGTHAPILTIQTTTFGSVDLAMSNTTAQGGSRGILATGDVPRPEPVIATTWHWPAPLSISGYAGTAMGDYLDQLPKLAAAFPGRVIGTAHPKADWPERMKRTYARFGIPFVADFEDVCRQADVLVFDNTSAGFEFAATGRPVVVLNGRYWSRKQSHGLRFWDASHVGVNVQPGDDLVAKVREALEDRPALQENREEALQIVYGRRSGAAEAGARVIVEWLERGTPSASRLLKGRSEERGSDVAALALSAVPS